MRWLHQIDRRYSAKASAFFCYGLGRAGFFYESLHHAPDAYGKEVYFLTETITPNFGPGDLFIVSSASGETAQLVALAKKHVSGGAVAVLTTNRHATITEFVDVIVQNQCPSKSKDSVFRSAQPMASLYEQALLVIADALVMKMAAESGAPESELFKRHANLE